MVVDFASAKILSGEKPGPINGSPLYRHRENNPISAIGRNRRKTRRFGGHTASAGRKWGGWLWRQSDAENAPNSLIILKSTRLTRVSRPNPAHFPQKPAVFPPLMLQSNVSKTGNWVPDNRQSTHGEQERDLRLCRGSNRHRQAMFAAVAKTAEKSPGRYYRVNVAPVSPLCRLRVNQIVVGECRVPPWRPISFYQSLSLARA